MSKREKCFSMGLAILFGSVEVDEERFLAAARNSVGGKREQKEE